VHIFSAIFVSSSTTDGLLGNDLSGGGPTGGGPGTMAPYPLNPAQDRNRPKSEGYEEERRKSVPLDF